MITIIARSTANMANLDGVALLEELADPGNSWLWRWVGVLLCGVWGRLGADHPPV